MLDRLTRETLVLKLRRLVGVQWLCSKMQYDRRVSESEHIGYVLFLSVGAFTYVLPEVYAGRLCALFSGYETNRASYCFYTQRFSQRLKASSALVDFPAYNYGFENDKHLMRI